jgi:uncharacterized OB-fold protein
VTDWLVDDALAPAVDGSLAPLYEAAARGELALPCCSVCGRPTELEQLRCDGCGAVEIAWTAVEPRGTVHATTTVHRREPGLIVASEPYHVVDVELVSGHRLLMSTSAPTATPPAIGDAALVVFRHVGSVPVPALAVTDATSASSPRPTTESPTDPQEVTP